MANNLLLLFKWKSRHLLVVTFFLPFSARQSQTAHSSNAINDQTSYRQHY